jgi:hypothetical protein
MLKTYIDVKYEDVQINSERQGYGHQRHDFHVLNFYSLAERHFILLKPIRKVKSITLSQTLSFGI